MPETAVTNLVLEATDYVDLAHWRWVLKDGEGRFLGDHQVSLDTSAPEYEGFIDLAAFLDRRVTPGLHEDRQGAEERHLLSAFGKWLGRNLFGDLGVTLRAHAPAVVKVRSPVEADQLAMRPLEAAIFQDETLAEAHIALVHEVEGDAQRMARPPTRGPLRILAVFSLPPAQSPLNLRVERQALRETVAALQGSGRQASIELRTLQYGATRETLRSALEEGEGWDVVHFSGHGGRGILALERSDATIDLLGAEDLAALLREHSGRLKLVTLSACQSGAGTVAATLAGLGLNLEVLGLSDEEHAQPISPIARVLARALDCAIVAMRFPVEDRFAIAFTDAIYRQLLEKRVRLPQAFLRAVHRAGAVPEISELSRVTPALFGRRALDLSLSLEPATLGFAPPETGLFAFPEPPSRFVGRVASLTRASAALALDSQSRGVLFHGMAGAGKSACALELADHMRQTHRFAAWVWFKAPDPGRDVSSALRDLALALEAQLPAFAMLPVVGRKDALLQWLPRFKAMLAGRAILVVLDNLESLLSEAGTWRDPQFGAVVDALLTHNGLSRVILTSQRVPAKLPSAVIVEPIHALPLTEAALLMSQPPRLYRFFHGSSIERTLGRRLLNVVQGHPKLIELAEGLASDASVLEAHVERAEGAWRSAGDPLAAFFAQGSSAVSGTGFLAALSDWTSRAVDAVPAASRALFEVLCIIEPADRNDWLLRSIWPHLKIASRLLSIEDEIAALAAPLADAGLVERQFASAAGWSIHPGVAARGLASIESARRREVDTLLGNFWTAIHEQSRVREATGDGAWLVRSGLAAAPYLVRTERWSAASEILEHTMIRDDSGATAGVVLDWFRVISEATVNTAEGLRDQAKLARALRAAGRNAESEYLALKVLEAAEDLGENQVASAVAGNLVDLFRGSGRLGEALSMAERKATHSIAAGLGPWTALLDSGARLGVLSDQGQHEAVLAEVPALRQRLAELPAPGKNENALPWNVGETLLDLERYSASQLYQWERALELNAQIGASQSGRGAEPLQLASTRYNDYHPLVALKRFPEARALIEECRPVFETDGNPERLAGILAATASLEHAVRGPAAAIVFAEAALRLHYRAQHPAGCAAGHFNLANYLMWASAPAARSLAHHVAATAIGLLTQSGMLRIGFNALVVQILALGPGARNEMPASFEQLRVRVDAVDGVAFLPMIEMLNNEQTNLEGLVKAIVEKAFQLAAGVPDASEG